MLNVEALITLVAVIDTGSFSAAAQQIGQTPSGVSRTISRLEQQLGMTLLKRTTRRQNLTEEGEWLLVRARKLLADLQETEEHFTARRSQPSGLVRLNAATPALDHLVAPFAAEFMELFPFVRLELVSGETVVDLLDERADLAIRIGPLADSTLNARRLGHSRVRILASPAYLARHGAPTTIEDLASHRLLGFTKPSSLNIWPLPQQDGGGLQIQPVLAASSGSTLLQLAIENAGIVCLADFLTSAAISSGRLVPVMESLTLPWTQPVWAVFYKPGALAPRVSVLLEFLAKKLAGKALQD